MYLGVLLQLVAGGVQQRPRQQQSGIAQQGCCCIGAVHARHAGHARTTQDLQQHGFSLIIEVMRRQQQAYPMRLTQLPQRLIAANTGSLFNAALIALIKRNTTIVILHLKSGALLLTMLLPAVGIGAEPMMNVKGKQLDTMLTRKSGSQM